MFCLEAELAVKVGTSICRVAGSRPAEDTPIEYFGRSRSPLYARDTKLLTSLMGCRKDGWDFPV